MKEKFKKSVHSRNLIKVLNTWAVPLVRYSGPFLNWTREELQQTDQRTIKLVTMYSKDDTDNLYVSREKGRRGRISIKGSIDTLIRRLEDYIKKNKERLITVTRNNTSNKRMNRTIIARKQKWKEKQMYGYFKRKTSKISQTWTCLRKGNIERETESLLTAAKNKAIRTN